MKVPFLASYRLSPWLPAHAALMGGLTYIGAVGAAVVAAASQDTLVEETIIAASTGIVSGLIGVLSIVWARHLRRTRPTHPPIGHHMTIRPFKFTTRALAAALAACAAPAPSWSAAQPSGSPLLARTIGPALDCSDYDNIFTTPDAVKLPLSSCRRP
jgi:hypothetical protein